ncbi:ead/Ea22-like family protein [Enterobacter kobei]|uniref:ead/Ea22-like family protein n=1 Tax=Enterobacter kobei TaxID=208224 RepID=UPI001F156F54|nr:ead/Ea22-like family protein [Enterobacter kobei]HCR0432920.1 ead/Ea22-like family protein [Enterobacter kobei]
MSNIDKQALREAALEADEALQIMKSDIEVNPGHVDSINAFYSMLSPDTVLALLDELEAKDNRINRLEAIVAVAEQRNALMREWKRALKVPCDLVDNQVPVVIHGMVIRLERLKETEAKLEAAEKRIAKLEAKLDSADKLQDSAFRHGLQHGFSLGQTDNQVGFEECLSAYGTGKGE